MDNLKKVWFTSYGVGLASLSLESNLVSPEWRTLQIVQHTFPDRETNTPRHTICITLFSKNDLQKLVGAINKHLENM